MSSSSKASAKLDLPLPLRPTTSVSPGPGGTNRSHPAPMPRNPCTEMVPRYARLAGVGVESVSAAGGACRSAASSNRARSSAASASSAASTSSPRPHAKLFIRIHPIADLSGQSTADSIHRRAAILPRGPGSGALCVQVPLHQVGVWIHRISPCFGQQHAVRRGQNIGLELKRKAELFRVSKNHDFEVKMGGKCFDAKPDRPIRPSSSPAPRRLPSDTPAARLSQCM